MIQVSRLFVILILLCSLPVSTACQKQRRPDRFLIPDGYVGWVKIYFEIPNAAALRIEDGHYIFDISSTGVLKTSSKLEDGFASDDFFYVSGKTRTRLVETGWGGGGMIHAGYTGSGGDDVDGVPAIYQGFFVGPEEQLKKYGFEMKERVGPIKTDG